MINRQLLEVSMCRPSFHDPKDVRATEVRLYSVTWWWYGNVCVCDLPYLPFVLGHRG